MEENRTPRAIEFVALMALLSAILALSIDAMLPALGDIGQSFEVDGNTVQFTVGAIFLGSAIGQLVSGALSDAYGRRPVVYWFIGIFLFGTLVCVTVDDFSAFIAGRVLQGIGAAGPQIISIAIIRDRCSGREMARITSFVMSVFIIVPIVAPLIGQGVLGFAEWRAIFGLLGIVAVMSCVWFALRQPETLPVDQRTSMSPGKLWAAALEVLGDRSLVIYTLVRGVILGAFIGYLSSAKQIFQDIYEFGAMFPVAFAMLSLAIGFATTLNGMLVLHFGMKRLTIAALWALIFISAVFLCWHSFTGAEPAFAVSFVWLSLVLFFVGFNFGNVSALALRQVGAKAGMGATLFGGLSTLLALPVGSVIGQSFNGTLMPLAAGFIVTPCIALGLMAFDKVPDDI